MPVVSKSQEKWWKTATIYQIYPASFCDSNGDGIGDLPGILSKLDYVKDLGVDAIWISPFYDSPNEDQGYDISDYQKPLAAYGTLQDVEDIIKGCHDRGLKILFDLVINHTSWEHKWFKESRKSKDNPYRNYYIWQPARYIDGKRYPPTNWEATFGGSAWEWDPTTEEYYLHTFVPGQPDLNFTVPSVRDAIWDEAILFWLDKGIDGMRVDVSNFYSKADFEDVEVVRAETYEQPASHKWIDGPHILEYLTEMQERTFAKYDAVTLAEMPGKRTLEEMLKFVAKESNVFSMAITFDLMGIDHGQHGFWRYGKPWKLSDFKRITKTEQQLALPEHGSWLNNYLENHDQARSVSRFMNDSAEYRVISAKTLAIYLLTLSGTPCIYEGEELGMVNFPREWSEDEYADPASKMFMVTMREAVEKGNKDITVEGGFDSLQRLGRDHARTPMQWSAEKQAGFSTADKTWMRVMDNYKEINAATEDKDADSVLNFYRKMLKLRQEYKSTMVFGVFDLLDPENEKTIVFTKKSDTGETIAVALNFSGEKQPLGIPGQGKRELVVSSALKSGSEDELDPYEGRVYKL